MASRIIYYLGLLDISSYVATLISYENYFGIIFTPILDSEIKNSKGLIAKVDKHCIYSGKSVNEHNVEWSTLNMSNIDQVLKGITQHTSPKSNLKVKDEKSIEWPTINDSIFKDIASQAIREKTGLSKNKSTMTPKNITTKPKKSSVAEDSKVENVIQEPPAKQLCLINNSLDFGDNFEDSLIFSPNVCKAIDDEVMEKSIKVSPKILKDDASSTHTLSKYKLFLLIC